MLSSRFSRPLCVLSVAVILTACAGTTPDPSAANNPAPIEATDVALDALIKDASVAFEGRLSQIEPRPDFATPLSEQLRRRLTGSDDRLQQFVVDHYAARGNEPLIIPGGFWNERSQAVLDAIANAQDHAIDAPLPDGQRLFQGAQRLHRASQASGPLRGFEPSAGDWATVRETLLAEGFDARDPDALERLFKRLLDPGSDNPMPRLAGRLRNLIWSYRSWQQGVAELEAELAFALARYAYDMRLGKDDTDFRLSLWRGISSRWTRRRARLGAFFNALSTDDTGAMLATLWSPHPGYADLVQARRRYAEMMAAGGWPTVELDGRVIKKLDRHFKRRRLPRGQSFEGIAEVKQRLIAEGYPAGEVNDVYDDALIEAIKDYQDSHQFEVDGELGKKLIRNLNRPVEDRLAKIDVTLRRYREEIAGHFEYYILVNVPGFHTEVWRQGEREMRFRIIVGNNQKLHDPVTGELLRDKDNEPQFANRTPMQNAFLRSVIYNPYWNVPRRIKEEEIDPQIAENPFWLEENNYEIVNEGEPGSYIRERPGPDNTLGRVKFIFPNPYNTYLHDTRGKSYFKRPIRALSHGCMRVHQPLDFAEYLLRTDGQYNARRINEILSSSPPEETNIRLRRVVPVHVVYLNTRVNERGHVEFLSDIYKYDKDRVARRIATLRKQRAVASGD